MCRRSWQYCRQRDTELSRDGTKPNAQDYELDYEMGLQESQNRSNDSRTIWKEVAPGIDLRLGGSKETWAAINESRLTRIRNCCCCCCCCCCLAELHCIKDAELVLLVICPYCLASCQSKSRPRLQWIRPKSKPRSQGRGHHRWLSELAFYCYITYNKFHIINSFLSYSQNLKSTIVPVEWLAFETLPASSVALAYFNLLEAP